MCGGVNVMYVNGGYVLFLDIYLETVVMTCICHVCKLTICTIFGHIATVVICDTFDLRSHCLANAM